MSKKHVTASDVAQYIIELRQMDNRPPSPLELQKLLYFIQRDWMRKTGSPLFNDDFEAWQFGPVIPKIYKKYQLFGSSPIWAHYDRFVDLPSDVKEFIKYKIITYKAWSPWELVSATHRFGTAWNTIWNNGAGKGETIPKKLIKKESADVN